MAKTKGRTPDYNLGFKEGFNSGYSRGRGDAARHDFDAIWIYVNGNWYCSRCDTKHEQKHDDFCCKCGARMNTQEAD